MKENYLLALREFLEGPMGSTCDAWTLGRVGRGAGEGARVANFVCLCAWRQEVSSGICPILSTLSYQVVNLSFDLVNNVES
jgi:hypothetical protein